MEDSLFELNRFDSIQGVRRFIKDCQINNHVQQVAYSTYHDCLTQVCFGCQKIRTSMGRED